MEDLGVEVDGVEDADEDVDSKEGKAKQVGTGGGELENERSSESMCSERRTKPDCVD